MKLRKLKKESFSKPNKDDTLEMPYKKIYGLEHLAIRIIKKVKRSHQVREKEVVYFLWILQLIFVAIAFLV